MLTLWDLLKPIKDAVVRAGRRPKPAPQAMPAQRPSRKTRPKPGASEVVTQPAATPRRRPPARKRNVPPPAQARPVPAPAAPAQTMQEKYDAVTREMLARYDVRVRKWRTSMSGIAWYVTYKDGRVQRLIESPKPKGPMSAAIFLHEVGHHAIGFNVYKPRCLEEYHAWQFSLREMERLGLNITDSVQRRVSRSLHYAVAKAQRRGIKQIPQELTPYLVRPR